MTIPPPSIRAFLDFVVSNGTGAISSSDPAAAKRDLQKIYKFRIAERKELEDVFGVGNPQAATSWDTISFKVEGDTIYGEFIPDDVYAIRPVTREELLRVTLTDRRVK